MTGPLQDSQDAITKLLMSKEGWWFLFRALILLIACYSLISQKPVTFHMDKPFDYTIPISLVVGIALAADSVIGLLIVRSILPGLSSPLIQCPNCKKPGAYVKSATYHCDDCGDSTTVGIQKKLQTRQK